MKHRYRDIYTDRQGFHRWRVVGGNGRIIAASSEGFSSAASARRNFNTTFGAMRDTMMRAWRKK